MAKPAVRKPSAPKKVRKKAASARKRLTPSREARGIAPADAPLALDAPELAPLVELVRKAGGAALGGYREPLSGKPLLLAALPRDAVEPTPFQRDLSPTHAKRLAQKIDESGAFLDPIIAVRAKGGGFWTPNGRHRLAAAKVLGLREVTALVSLDEELAFRILALNTEKAHNLRDRSLEVIRMARALARQDGKARESSYAAQFEGPELLTLGVVYESEPRFAGGAYAPFLKKVDRFGEGPLATTLREREGFAARLREIDAAVKGIVKQLAARGFRSPYLRSFVVARINPLRWIQGEIPPLEKVLGTMRERAIKFNTEKVRQEDLVRAGGAPDEEAS